MKLKACLISLNLFLMFASGCTDINAYPKLEKTDAMCVSQGETSLVSLVLPRVDDLRSLRAVDLQTGNPIRFEFFETGPWIVVTLKLPMNKEAAPHLIINEEKSFMASIKPEHSMSLFDELDYGDCIVFLRDHGEERLLELSKEQDILHSEVVKLWVANKFVSGVRVKFTNPGSEENLSVLAEGCEIAVVRKNEGLLDVDNFKLGAGESVTFVASPSLDAGTSYLSVVAH